MYLPTEFEVSDQKTLLAFIDQWSFGELITNVQGRITANPLPFLVDQQEAVLYGHLGTANPQLEELFNADDVLVSFTGPHAYVSPSWYQTQDLVPTWNFCIVQLRGKICRLDEQGLEFVLQQLTAKHEAQFEPASSEQASSEQAWDMASIAEDKMQIMKNMISGFKIEITEISGKFKLSQNRSEQDQRAVIKHLQGQPDEMSRLLAREMQVRLGLDYP